MSAAAVLVAVSALVVASWMRAAGTAISRIPRADALRDASDGISGAEQVAELLEEREAITPAVGLVASALLVIAAVVTMAVVVPGTSGGGALLIALAVGVTVLLLGDLLPRQLGRRWPRGIGYRSSGLLRVAVKLGGWAIELMPDAAEEDSDTGVGPAYEVDEDHERELIDSVLEFGETVVREVMTPRPDMVTVPIGADLDELVSTATREGYSRVPVTDNGDIVGLVIVKDLLPLLSHGERPSVAQMMRPVEFVPDSKLASALLAEMQESHAHQMIVVDEYGDVAGLVTIEDLLEELVGEIADESDEEEVFITPLRNGTWVIDARLPVEDLADAAGVELPNEEWDTVGGLVLGLAERVPEEGERFKYETLTLTVTRMQGRRVSEVEVSVGQIAEAG
ncbi:MAG: hemolysin family protein [Actinobacteria bacterium]|nr:hemolysin family protein [Actinomycetota bacterium]